MAQKKSMRHVGARKAARQAVRRQSRNRMAKKGIKSAVKTLMEAATAKDANKAPKLLADAKSLLDKGASRGLFHWKAAARKKSRLEERVRTLLAAAKPAV